MMSKQIFKWYGREVDCYSDSNLLAKAKNLKFYESFIKGDSNYRIGDFVFVVVKDKKKVPPKICVLKCLYEERNEPKALVVLYEYAINLRANFLRISEEFDERNEVVRNDREEIIRVKDIVDTCRVILGVKSDSVSEIIDDRNLSREIYFLCRYQYNNETGSLSPILNEEINNEISIEEGGETSEYVHNFSNRTPSPKKVWSSNKEPCIKKNCIDAMEVDFYMPQLAQVKRNLNLSFNDSQSDDCSSGTYTIIDPPNGDLKLKLKKDVLKLSTSQPVVLLDKINPEDLCTKTSPLKKSVQTEENKMNNNLKETSKNNTSKLSTSRKGAELRDLNCMLQNWKINDTPSRCSPRKLRRVSKPFYYEIFSDSDSDNFTQKRKSNRIKTRINYEEDSVKNERITRTPRSTRNLETIILSDYEDDECIETHKKKRSTRNLETITLSDYEDDKCINTNYQQNDPKTESHSEKRSKREVSKPFYCENLSDSDSDNFSETRKSSRIKTRVSYQDLTVNNERTPRTRRSTRNSEMLNDAEDDKYTKFKNQISHNYQETYSPSTPIGKRKSPTKKKISESKSTTKLDSIKESNKLSKTTPKSNRILKNYTPLKLIREGTLTPSIDQRKKSVMKNNTPLVLARNNLHVSYVPTVLPCREKEYEDVYNFIEGKLLDKCGGCMYISGVPGTGKTATVTVAIENLIRSWKKDGHPEFNYVLVNGMRLTEPRQCYVEILKQLTGKRMPWEQALSLLEERFTTKSTKKVVPTVLLIDELDILCTKRQDVVYNLLDWPTKTNAQLIVITIANTMDLPERLLMSRVTSRLGLTRLTFQAYTHKQLQEIVANRLSGNNSFKSDAVQFVARKVASVSGDARRALDICRRSAEIAEMEGPTTQVSMKHVNAALDAMITEPKVKAIAHCSKLEKLVLQSVIAEVERTGVEETVFNDVYIMLISLAALEGFKMISYSLMASAVYRLSSCRLILADQKCADINQRIILNVSADDVYYALKKD